MFDTTGFVLDTSGYGATGTNTLAYRHRPGTQYPVTCLVAPQTNLDWRNYEFSGTIIKPAGNVYDSVVVGVVFYQKDAKNYYSLRVNGKANDTSGNANKFYIVSHFERDGSEWDSVMGPPLSAQFSGSTDTMNFSVRIITSDYQDTIKDGEVSIEAVTWPQTSSKPAYPSPLLDISTGRKIEGYPGVVFDYENTSLSNGNTGSGIMVQNIKTQKVGNQ